MFTCTETVKNKVAVAQVPVMAGSCLIKWLQGKKQRLRLPPQHTKTGCAGDPDPTAEDATGISITLNQFATMIVQ